MSDEQKAEKIRVLAAMINKAVSFVRIVRVK